MSVMALHQERTMTDRGTTMNAIVSAQYGLDGLEFRELDTPEIEDDQVLVRVHASSVNPAEWYRVTGPYFARLLGGGIRRPKSAAVGGDLAGTVEIVGKDVEEFQPGDEVFGTTLGAWAEYAPAREVRLVRKPANVSFEEAAAVPIAAIDRPPGAPRPGADPARAEGPDQRRVRRCRHLRRAARKGARSGGDRRLQHAATWRRRDRSARTTSSTTRRRTSRSAATVTT